MFVGGETEPERHQVTQLSSQWQWQGWTGEKALACYHSANCHSQKEQEARKLGPMGEMALPPAPPGWGPDSTSSVQHR